MLKGIFLTEKEMDTIVEFLNGLDAEIGSTITFCHDRDAVLSNMQHATSILHSLKNMLDE